MAKYLVLRVDTRLEHLSNTGTAETLRERISMFAVVAKIVILCWADLLVVVS